MRIAVAGLGWWGKEIVRCLKRSAKFEVLYGIDPVAQPGVDIFVRESGIRYADNLNAALADPAVEGIILATPHSLHEEQILAVLAADKNVFCEKPLTMSGAGAVRVVEACHRAGKVLGVGHERRYEPAFEELARLIAKGALGRLLHLEANVSHDLFRNAEPSNWRLDPAHAPAGLMTGVGIHLTDLFISFAGPPAEVRAQTSRMVFKPPAEDFMTATITFRSGVRATVTSLSATPYYGRLAAFGENGWAEAVSEANVDQGRPTVLTRSAPGGQRQTTVYQAVDTVSLNLEAWEDAVAGRAPYRFTEEQLVDNIRLFEAIVRSSRQDGAAIAL